MTRYRRSRNNVKQEISKEELHPEALNDLVIWPKHECFFQTGEIHSVRFDIYELNGRICINGFYVYGWVEYRNRCTICGHIMIFDMGHDDHFCPDCNTWLYPVCRDPECEICTTRPIKPLPDFGINDDTFPERTRRGWEDLYVIQLDI